ncbi:hypothetical protein KIM372_02180 [Bombiscardovia nodaiensis]|uniref:Uncharacterized protein n=1 Tax=Bombiscardovia nodaiensis TaxID=2932181 RepID=A0ABM8B621_9BIFI|nr:hypothetical protein KIM372_02180 [Bombiscardovia nodaiensis]
MILGLLQNLLDWSGQGLLVGGAAQGQVAAGAFAKEGGGIGRATFGFRPPLQHMPQVVLNLGPTCAAALALGRFAAA